MTPSRCLGCEESFDTPKGLKIHRRSCKTFSSTTRSVLLKRRWLQEGDETAKIPRNLNDTARVRREFAAGEGPGPSSKPESGNVVTDQVSI